MIAKRALNDLKIDNRLKRHWIVTDILKITVHLYKSIFIKLKYILDLNKTLQDRDTSELTTQLIVDMLRFQNMIITYSKIAHLKPGVKKKAVIDRPIQVDCKKATR